MTGIEKGMIASIIITFILVSGTVFFGLKSCNDAGGVKQILIGAGKEWKEITKEVNDYEPEK